MFDEIMTSLERIERKLDELLDSLKPPPFRRKIGLPQDDLLVPGGYIEEPARENQ